jgi:cold shock CspA family protein
LSSPYFPSDLLGPINNWRRFRSYGNCEIVLLDEGDGFIAPEVGGADVFFTFSAVEKAGDSNLTEGARVN